MGTPLEVLRTTAAASHALYDLDRLTLLVELAKLAGVSPQTVLNLEHGRGEQAQRRTIRKLAQALGVDPHELVKAGR